MNTNTQPLNAFAARHIGPNPDEQAIMLNAIGAPSLSALIEQTIPADIHLPQPLDMEPAMTENQFAEHIADLANENKLFTSYIGRGWYDTVTPAVIQRNVFENPSWYTSYTPYQAEISQGRLEALFLFQSMVSDLTGLPLANASLLDDATAAAEAVNMLYGLRSKEQVEAGANTLFVDELV
ncbi:MAG: glycine dehydrogenase (aminomethyl-transferring), partial [Bacteroidales bacterium]|nr:glycine dehydrogenase (aminomethyl-transferring) [Bacteroidales bacterium]